MLVDSSHLLSEAIQVRGFFIVFIFILLVDPITIFDIRRIIFIVQYYLLGSCRWSHAAIQTSSTLDIISRWVLILIIIRGEVILKIDLLVVIMMLLLLLHVLIIICVKNLQLSHSCIL